MGALGTEEPASIHRAAAAGVSGAGSPLPYFDRIQEAFGGHDLTRVRAHVGGEASAASEHMGAQAYASGDHIAFRTQPDLHTAAHEMASPTDALLNGVWGSGPEDVFAVGEGGTVLHYDGQSWQEMV